jgi:hypothetical protein
MAAGQWDWQALDVEYGSVAHELRAGSYYLRLLLPKMNMQYEVRCPSLSLSLSPALIVVSHACIR